MDRRPTRRTVLVLLALGLGTIALRPWLRLLRRRPAGREARFYRRITAVALAAGLGWSAPAAAESVQRPVVAGSFYPADAAQLRADVRRFLTAAGRPVLKGEILALISPHAGYVYSGPVAGSAYKELAGRSYDLVVLLAPSHTAATNGVAVLDVDAYRTPLGDVPIDRAAAADLMRRASWIQHVPALFAREHSLEVQLPFLQEALGGRLSILPLVLGNPSPGMASALADVLAASLRGRRVLYVASSDMSHYHGYEDASRMDRQTLDLIAEGDLERLFASCDDRQGEMCGLGPVQVVMRLAEKAGIDGGTVLRYANSGDTAGGKDRVVGYGALAFVNPPDALSLADKAALVALARGTVEAVVREG